MEYNTCASTTGINGYSSHGSLGAFSVPGADLARIVCRRSVYFVVAFVINIYQWLQHYYRRVSTYYVL